MAKGKRDGLLIAGGGLAGCLAAIAMARTRPEVPLLLVEEGDKFGGDHIWSFYDDDVAADDRWLIESLIAESREGYYVAFPGHSRKFRATYNNVRSTQLDAAVREWLRPDQYRLGTKVVAVREDELVLTGGEKIKADGAIDARGAANLSMLDLGWRKFVGREFLFAQPHKVDRPVLMDATVEQTDGFRFFQCIPFSDTRMLIEDCHYSDNPDLDADPAGQIDAYLELRKWKKRRMLREERGALPVALGGDFGAFWRVGGARVAKFGLRGGFFHPTTGYTLPDAVRNAVTLTKQRDFAGAALHDLFEEEAAALWRKREAYRSFNSALFSAEGQDRRSVFEDFYRLDPALITRFHAGGMGMLDRMKLGKLGR
jgi:lycopene beta-cyclase